MNNAICLHFGAQRHGLAVRRLFQDGEQSAVVDGRELLSVRDAVDMAPIPCSISLVFLPFFDSICSEDAEPQSD